MPEDFEHLQLWYSPEYNLVHTVMEKAIPIQLVFTPKRMSDTVRLDGVFVQVQDNSIRFGVTGGGEEMDTLLQDKPLHVPLPCEVLFRIDYGQFAEDVIMPGEYTSNGEILGMERDVNNKPSFFDLRVRHHFTRRKTRRFQRATWNPASDSLVRLLVVRGEPANRGELSPLLLKAMHEKDKSHDLMDISSGGARINVETQMAVRPLRMDESYLMLLLPDKKDRAMLPYVFLAKKIAVAQDEQDANKSALRLHFVSELDWKESTRDKLAWVNIGENGSRDLKYLLET